MREYTQGICQDGAAILCDGQPMTPENIINRLKAMESTLLGFKDQYHVNRVIEKQIDNALNT